MTSLAREVVALQQLELSDPLSPGRLAARARSATAAEHPGVASGALTQDASSSRPGSGRQAAPTGRPRGSQDSGSGQDGEEVSEPWQDPDIVRKATSQYKKRTGPFYDFGPGHVPGQHPSLDPSQPVPNLPPLTGMGVKLRPARLDPDSCRPPPFPEPLIVQPYRVAAQLATQDTLRAQQTHILINRTVYDSLQPPPAPQDATAAGGEPEAREERRASGASIGSAAGGGRGAGAGAGGEDRSSAERDSRGTASTAASTATTPRPRGGSTSHLPAIANSQGSYSTNNNSSATTGAQQGTSLPPRPSAAAARTAKQPGSSSSRTQGTVDSRTQGSVEADDSTRERVSSGSAASTSGRVAGRWDYYPDMPAWYSQTGPSDLALVFESRFESGNLRTAVQVFDFEYDLVLRPDINTKGHTQWFFFAISNMRKGYKYKLNIINLTKPDSLYNYGMQPLVHSSVLMSSQQIGWHRSGEQIAYYQNNIKTPKGKRYYTLTFSLRCMYDNDLVHVAHCYPYTYTDLQTYLKAVELDPTKQSYVQRSTMCASLAGNPVDCLTITAPDRPEVIKKRRGVVISARVHPGETNASWMCKGVLDMLLSHTPLARKLRSMFVFTVIPMLNPDGVIVGNYRCSLAAQDLNRVWNDPSKKLHPTIHALKTHLKTWVEEREVTLFCDLHGHSRRHDIFAYGCQKKDKDTSPMYPGYPVPGSMGTHPAVPARLQDKVLPLLLYHSAPDLFAYGSCAFKVQKSKAGTGRVVGFRELGLVNSFTLEASFAGPSTGRWAGHHFTTMHLELMGAALLSALADMWDTEQYGFKDLVAELEFLHPPGMEGGRRCIRDENGQLVEVEGEGDDEGMATDSDDESTDEEEKRAARALRRQQQAQAQPAQAAPGEPQLSKKARRAKVAREQLKQQEQRAAEAVMACLPMLGAAANDEPPSLAHHERRYLFARPASPGHLLRGLGNTAGAYSSEPGSAAYAAIESRLATEPLLYGDGNDGDNAGNSNRFSPRQSFYPAGGATAEDTGDRSTAPWHGHSRAMQAIQAHMAGRKVATRSLGGAKVSGEQGGPQQAVRGAGWITGGAPVGAGGVFPAPPLPPGVKAAEQGPGAAGAPRPASQISRDLQRMRSKSAHSSRDASGPEVLLESTGGLAPLDRLRERARSRGGAAQLGLTGTDLAELFSIEAESLSRPGTGVPKDTVERIREMSAKVASAGGALQGAGGVGDRSLAQKVLAQDPLLKPR